MMEKRSQELLIKLEMKLQEFIGLTPIDRMRSEVIEVKIALKELENIVRKESFSDHASEVFFFKHVKPRFYSFLILAVELYNFHVGRPICKGKKGASYLQLQLDYISKIFSQYGFMYEYYKTGATELDALYFLRGVSFSGLVSADLPALDPSFSTVGDYLFSKFIALEKMQGVILSEIEGPKNSSVIEVKSKKGRVLRWTGDSTNLIELLYGLAETKQFNDGDVDISDMVDVFEQVFNVNLSNYFRRFTTIKRRKSVSKTRFLDEMVQAVNKRIDDADAYVPAWAK